MNDMTVAKKDNSYMFLTTPRFKILDVKIYLAPGLSYDGWCKLSHVGSVGCENFYPKLKGRFTITPDEYTEFVRELHSRGCVMMMDWL